MKHRIINPGVVAGIAALALSACSDDEMVDLPIGPPPMTMADVPEGTEFRLDRGAGLETIDTSGEDPYAEEDAFLVKTAAGYDLTLPDGQEVEIVGDEMEPVTRGDKTYLSTEVPLGEDGNRLRLTMHGKGAGLSYAEYGDWAVIHSAGPVINAAAWATGLPTETMPTSGTAQYEGATTGQAHFNTEIFDLAGKTQITANFADGSIDGRVSELEAMSGGTTVSNLNDIALSGTIVENGFAGEAVAQEAAISNYFFDLTGATGRFGGRFYGPNAEEAAGTFRIQSSYGLDVVGSFGLRSDRP